MKFGINKIIVEKLLNSPISTTTTRNWEAILSEISSIKQVRVSDSEGLALLVKTKTSADDMLFVRRIWYALYRAVYGDRNKFNSKYWGMCVHYEWDFFSVFYEWYVSQPNWRNCNLNNNLIVVDSPVISPTTSLLISKDLDNLLLSKCSLPADTNKHTGVFFKLRQQRSLTTDPVIISGINNLIRHLEEK